MDLIPIILLGVVFIVLGLITIFFPKFMWLNDFGANNRKKKYSNFEKKDTVFSGYLFILLGLLMSVGGAITQW